VGGNAKLTVSVLVNDRAITPLREIGPPKLTSSFQITGRRPRHRSALAGSASPPRPSRRLL